ncbi:MAG: GntR family transcriptional regulator [Oscillospiraceae bacterium]|nr:GntR family transcriptional regulator [Oscillospiraceae bacterium]
MSGSSKRQSKYLSLIENLNALIRQNVYQADTCLPSERELCERYNVSRITVRKALSEMEAAGTIYRIQGKGAFIRKEKFSGKLSSLTSLTEDMQELNVSFHSRILALEMIPASARVAGMLQLEESTTVLMLKRLRIAGGKPLAIETTYLPPTIAQTVRQHIDDDVSLYGILRKECGTPPVMAEQNLEIGLLLPWEQSLLGENAPSYAMFTTRVTYDKDHVPLEYVEGKYRGDRYTYRVSMTSESSLGWSQA